MAKPPPHKQSCATKLYVDSAWNRALRYSARCLRQDAFHLSGSDYADPVSIQIEHVAYFTSLQHVSESHIVDHGPFPKLVATCMPPVTALCDQWVGMKNVAPKPCDERRQEATRRNRKNYYDSHVDSRRLEQGRIFHERAAPWRKSRPISSRFGSLPTNAFKESVTMWSASARNNLC